MLSVVECEDNRILREQIAHELQEIVRRAVGIGLISDTLDARMRRSWTNLGRPPWWRFVLCWDGKGHDFSMAFVVKMQTIYTDWERAHEPRDYCSYQWGKDGKVQSQTSSEEPHRSHITT